MLTPTIRDHFGLDNQGILTVVSLVALVALGSQVLFGFYADRTSRVRMATIGALVWAVFTLGTGLAPTILLLLLARTATGLGRAVNDPTHNSLIADYYPPAVRTEAYGFHRIANYVGLIIGPLLRRPPRRPVRLAGAVPRVLDSDGGARGRGGALSARTGPRFS